MLLCIGFGPPSRTRHKLDQDDLSFFFVIDPPALLIDGIVLASTLRASFERAEIIAYCPEPRRAMLPPYVAEFMASVGVSIRFMPRAPFQPHYKQGNKIVAACQPRETRHSIFLDTDTAIARPFDLGLIARDGQVSVVPEGALTWGKKQANWTPIYAMFGMEPPDERVVLARKAVKSLPYFNAGVVGFPTGSDFARLWMDTALAIDANKAVQQRRPWLDQIALPVAIARAGLTANVMDSALNLSMKRDLDKPWKAAAGARLDQTDALILHYHHPRYLEGTRYAGLVDAALRRFTSFDSLADLTREPHAREARARQVLREFARLKTTERTPEENARFNELRAQKDAIKAEGANPARFLALQPASILRGGAN